MFIPLFSLAALVVIAVSAQRIDWKLTGIGLGFGMLAVISGLLRSLTAAHANCPLCMAPVLLNRRCSNHRNCRKILGSHCLRVALSILFLNSFRCPYCNEPTAIKARTRPAETYPRRR